VAKKHTLLMKKYHHDRTRWTALKHLIETPLFVSSELTGMVQVAGLCGYAFEGIWRIKRKNYSISFLREQTVEGISWLGFVTSHT
jgi:hypothetical protein